MCGQAARNTAVPFPDCIRWLYAQLSEVSPTEKYVQSG